MGIKFHCPNGHKLNVKAFLAGKKGVCPKCGTKVRIPLVSEAGLVDSEVDEAGAEAPSILITSAAPASHTAAAAAGHPGGNGAAVAAPPLPLATAPAAAAHDPISEAPTAIWYVRPPSGGQYGPAKGDTMRSWLSEGRISSDSFVWRDGWADWRIAGQLFPNLQGVAAPVATALAPISTVNPLAQAHLPAKKRGPGNPAIAILAGLALLIVLLLAALAYIFIAFR